MQRKDPRRAPISDKRSSKIGIDSAMMKDTRQLTATQELYASANVPTSVVVRLAHNHTR